MVKDQTVMVTEAAPGADGAVRLPTLAGDAILTPDGPERARVRMSR
jgi:hypothetical protein